MKIWRLAQIVMAGLVLGELSASVAYGQPKPAPIRSDTPQNVTVDLTQITCRTALKMPADERSFTIIFYHGYLSGQNNETRFNGAELATITDKIADTCIDHPATPLLDVFKQYRAKPQK